MSCWRRLFSFRLRLRNQPSCLGLIVFRATQFTLSFEIIQNHSSKSYDSPSTSTFAENISSTNKTNSIRTSIKRWYSLKPRSNSLGTLIKRRHHSITGDSKRRRQAGETQTVQRGLLTATEEDYGSKFALPICRHQSCHASLKIQLYSTPRLTFDDTDNSYA